MVVSGTYYNPFQGLFTHSGAWGGLRSHILTKNWPFLTPPANPVKFFWLKMPSKCVPWIVLQVLSSTCTSRAPLRPPKRPSKAKNGQKISFFGPDQTILVRWPCSSVALAIIHPRCYNSKRPPLRNEPFGRNGGEPTVKKRKLAYIPTIHYIYTKKSFWPKQKGSNSSQIIQWSSVGYISIHFRGLRGLRRAPKPKFWLFDPKIQNGRFRPFSFSKVQKPYQWSQLG